MDDLVEGFLSRWKKGGDAGAEPSPELLDEVRAAGRRATNAWPSIHVPPRQLGEELASRLEAEANPASALAQCNVEELWLVVACAEGDAAALREFEERYVPDIRATLTRLGFAPSAADEAEQNVREMLFVAPEGRRPGILGFGGHGQLRGWLRAVASRAGFRLSRGQRPGVPYDEAMHAIAGKDDVELQYLKRTYGRAFGDAFREALAAMPVADRLLLKQRFQLQMTVTDLGKLHGVHASTISRWVTEARERLVSATRALMTERLGIQAGEMSSILRLIESQVDISLGSAASDGTWRMPG